MSNDDFSGTSRTVETDHERDNGPDVFRSMKSGQTSKLYFLGWLGGNRFGDQPVVFSPLVNYAFALPAHTILVEKLKSVAKLSPVIITCDKEASKSGDRSSAARYTVQVFDVVTENETIERLTKAWDDFVTRAKARSGGKSVEATGPRSGGTSSQPF